MTSSNSENVNVEKKSIDVFKEISEKNPTIDKKIIKKILSSYSEIVSSIIDSETPTKGKLFNLRMNIKNNRGTLVVAGKKK